jgi:magnesium-transporting ATPase (P-type)
VPDAGYEEVCAVPELRPLRTVQEFPADLVFLATEDEEGVCYVETANLDGETNLKLKYCPSATAHLTTAAELAPFAERHRLECETPNHRWAGMAWRAWGFDR